MLSIRRCGRNEFAEARKSLSANGCLLRFVHESLFL